MIALFFEVSPKAGQDDRYLEIAGTLRPELDKNFLLTAWKDTQARESAPRAMMPAY